MSTSPSWFDQEKFSRLVKKMGPKAPQPAGAPAVATRTPSPRPPEKDTRRLLRSLGSSGQLSAPAEPSSPKPFVPPARPRTSTLPGSEMPIRATPPEPSGKEGESTPSQFPPPMPVPEPRSVSPLARRTTPLPNLKPIFEYDKPESASQPLPGRPHLTPPGEAPKEGSEETESSDIPEKLEFPPLPPALSDFSSGWPSSTTEPAEDEEEEKKADPDELARVAQERDDARNEVNLLRAQLQQADEIIQASGIPGSNMEELTRTMEERDGARRDYANLREEFETLKQDQGRSAEESGSESSGSSTSFEGGEEVESLKSQIAGLESTVENLKQELDAVQGQIAQSRDDTSVAQRGLALSQKALQETRDALREASEGFSTSKSHLENLKNECASLAQQNQALQSQNDQITRELGAAKSKLLSLS